MASVSVFYSHFRFSRFPHVIILLRHSWLFLKDILPGDLETCLSMELIQFAEFIKLFIDNAALESTVSKEQQFYGKKKFAALSLMWTCY